ncbi:MAG: TIGR01459 family HAD-type hydrolase [Rhodocyclaceae bacterium]|nr:TIGR01459 family HAD-type hydrolase [Rhodocyclaceae bacterium]
MEARRIRSILTALGLESQSTRGLRLAQRGDPVISAISVKRPDLVAGMSALADYYDGFVIDQWGVMHDGRTAYDGAPECFRRLREVGKTIVVVTNSGKRADSNIERLAAMGFPRDTYRSVISSGEVLWRHLDARIDPFFRGLGRRCLLIGTGGDKSMVDGLAIELVDQVEECDFILLAGMDDNRPADFYEHWIEYGSRRYKPLVCANPDLVRIVNGELRPGCGALAHRYELEGGPLRYIGKPYPDIYWACRREFQRAGARRILAIGDSLIHDVAGGGEAGFDTAFVTEGIHKGDFAGIVDADSTIDRVVELARKEDVMPDWALPRLSW